MAERLWIKVDSGMAHQVKVKATAKSLRVSVPTFIGHWIILSGWAANFAEDGCIGDHDDIDIAHAALWRKKAETFVAALRKYGWIDNNGCIHEWEAWGGAGVVSRANARDRARKSRAHHSDVTQQTKTETETETRQEKELKAAARVPANRPDEDQVYLAERLAKEWDQELTIPALQKLNSRYGRPTVTGALRGLHGFPPGEAVRSLFAYVEAMCKEAAS